MVRSDGENFPDFFRISSILFGFFIKLIFSKLVKLSINIAHV